MRYTIDNIFLLHTMGHSQLMGGREGEKEPKYVTELDLTEPTDLYNSGNFFNYMIIY